MSRQAEEDAKLTRAETMGFVGQNKENGDKECNGDSLSSWEDETDGSGRARRRKMNADRCVKRVSV